MGKKLGNLSTAMAQPSTKEISLAQIYQRLGIIPEAIAIFCEKWDVSEFALFGSVVGDNFRAEGEQPIDMGVLFTYGKNARKYLMPQVRMQYELADLFDREVDLVSKTALSDDPNYNTCQGG
jgi:uncharacterized protein